MKQSNVRYLKEFLKYVSLNVIGMAALSGYILMDTFFVSKRLGTGGLAALNLAIPVYNLIHGAGLMLGMGGAAGYSVSRSRKEADRANAVFVNTVWAGGFLAALLFFCGVFGAGYLASLCGADAEIFEMTHIYLKILLLSAPFFLLNDILICFVRNDGNPKLSMLAMLGGSLSNIVLDYLFLFPLGMGMAGAVTATGLSAGISILILSVHWGKKKNHFHLIRMAPEAGILGRLFKTGFPSFVAEASSGIVIIAFNMIFLKLTGNTGVAAYGVVANLSLVVTAVCTGIAQGIQPLLSHAWGRKNIACIRCVQRYAMVTLLFVSAAVYLILCLGASPIAGAFNSEKDLMLQEIAETGIRLYFTGTLPAGFNIILCVNFASMEHAGPAQLISMLRGLILIVPVAFLMSAVRGVPGVWLAWPVTEAAVALLGAGIFMHGRKRRRPDGSGDHNTQTLE